MNLCGNNNSDKQSYICTQSQTTIYSLYLLYFKYNFILSLYFKHNGMSSSKKKNLTPLLGFYRYNDRVHDRLITRSYLTTILNYTTPKTVVEASINNVPTILSISLIEL
jgi:hypothetical protein